MYRKHPWIYHEAPRQPDVHYEVRTTQVPEHPKMCSRLWRRACWRACRCNRAADLYSKGIIIYSECVCLYGCFTEEVRFSVFKGVIASVILKHT